MGSRRLHHLDDSGARSLPTADEENDRDRTAIATMDLTNQDISDLRRNYLQSAEMIPKSLRLFRYPGYVNRYPYLSAGYVKIFTETHYPGRLGRQRAMNPLRHHRALCTRAVTE